jgi:hypothetical protein
MKEACLPRSDGISFVDLGKKFIIILTLSHFIALYNCIIQVTCLCSWHFNAMQNCAVFDLMYLVLNHDISWICSAGSLGKHFMHRLKVFENRALRIFGS